MPKYYCEYCDAPMTHDSVSCTRSDPEREARGLYLRWGPPHLPLNEPFR